ncbi:hypothetical protein LTR49_027581 [Elasticomyces elasticus]|nr:hypothetical protein LTR49_027581 [Elasticomyces elasticus]
MKTTKEKDSQPDDYSDRQLTNIEHVAEHAARLLASCPALKYDDWDVKGADRTVFRQRVRQAIKDLGRFAGEEDEEDATTPKAGGNTFSMSAATKRAESKVPWTIYTNLKLSYDILLGSQDEIMDASQDWLEASIYITAWWKGEDEAPGAVGLSKSSLRKSLSASHKTREVDVTPTAVYTMRLGEAFTYVMATDEALFLPETMEPVHVGLICVLTDGVKSVMRILRTWSLPIASAVIEFAALADWLPQARPRSKGLMEQGFSSEDLMVFSHGLGGAPQRQQVGEVVRDDVLAEYVNALAEKIVLRSTDGRTEREGRELAVAVLGRMDDQAEGERRIEELLGVIELSDEARVDKILLACMDLGLGEQARGIAKRYADTIVESDTQAYGFALIYYARAHATSKLQSTLALLTSLCLLHSTAVPAQAELDPQLASLLSGNRTVFVTLARIGTDAATLLASHLSGYATLRRYQELRDQDVDGHPLERARGTANTLIAVLESAADCIRGGLYDPEIESVVPVDGVLALLGEVLPLLGQKKRVFTEEQVIALLRIVEDLATVPLRILLQATLTAHRDGATSASRSQLLSKSRSDLSESPAGGLGGSSYDMLASSVMVVSEEKNDLGVATTASGWDWREGLDKRGGSEVGQKEVLMLVRVALVRRWREGGLER